MFLDCLIQSFTARAVQIVFGLTAAGFVYYSACEPGLHPGFPAAGVDKTKFWGRLQAARDNWARNGKEVLEQGSKQLPGGFQVITEVGSKIVLPNRLADEIRNHPDLHFGKAISSELFGSYPGFDPFGVDSSNHVVVSTVRGRLTQSLNFITQELADETSTTVEEIFGSPEQWTEITYKPMLLQLISRVSSRVFLGPELCANEDWLRISQEYAVDSLIAIRSLRQWPSYLRPVVHWFLPECRKLRATLDAARKIIRPLIEKRREDNRKAREAGEPTSKIADTIAWMDEAAKGRPYDVATAQLGLSFAAIHTTTEMVSGLISDLCANTEYFEPLRQEMASVLADKGWSKSALHAMKLVDSVMKESQRHHFGDIAAMHRIAERPVTLSDGTRIPEGAFTMISIDKMQDPTLFPDPNKFMGRRFLDMRQQPGQENRWQFVTTSPEHLAFGHGKHACPGRFFASNEIKVVLVYLLMKYDWKFTTEGRTQDKAFGQELDTDPTAKAMIRRRH